ncbi:MAG: hypothetical protein IH605_02460 [Burkholderiales bacterium]|nr:hypothetical protein [Burkholderiales bacterium]
MLWLRVAILGVVLAAVAGAVFKVTAFLHEKDLMIQERDQQILNLNAQVAGLRIDADRLKNSNASLEGEIAKKRDELAQAELEAKKISLADQASSKRLGELERKLNDQERIAKIERLSRSRRADLVLKIVNRSAECELENFFRTDGECKAGKWIPAGDRLVPKAETPAESQAQGEEK